MAPIWCAVALVFYGVCAVFGSEAFLAKAADASAAPGDEGDHDTVSALQNIVTTKNGAAARRGDYDTVSTLQNLVATKSAAAERSDQEDTVSTLQNNVVTKGTAAAKAKEDGSGPQAPGYEPWSEQAEADFLKQLEEMGEPPCTKKADFCNQMCDALGCKLTQNKCHEHCDKTIYDITFAMDLYCKDGICDHGDPAARLDVERVEIVDSHTMMYGAPEEPAAPPQPGATPRSPDSGCQPTRWYCSKMCQGLPGFIFIYEDCETTCAQSFAKLKPMWKEYCTGGIC